MASAATLVLKNASAVNVNYLPRKVATGSEAMYRDETQGVEQLQPRATLYYRENPSTRIVSVKLTFPVLDAITGAVDEELFKGEFRLPRKLSLANRQEILARTKAMLADVVVQYAVENGETPW